MENSQLWIVALVVLGIIAVMAVFGMATMTGAAIDTGGSNIREDQTEEVTPMGDYTGVKFYYAEDCQSTEDYNSITLDYDEMSDMETHVNKLNSAGYEICEAEPY